MPILAALPSRTIRPFDDHVLDDPYPTCGVQRLPGLAVHLDEREAWAMPRCAEAPTVLKDPDTFSSVGGVALTQLANAEIVAGTMFASDGHSQLRRVLFSQCPLRAIANFRRQNGCRGRRMGEPSRRVGRCRATSPSRGAGSADALERLLTSATLAVATLS
ncbi:hypothetical protein BJY54_006971 [Streptomyces nodosus]|uniref:hypothetical protein n=1 Tax=Streptomyces nodosus TaxID=40318 RepID=UPI00123DB779|nr:hypothetical protein [Streptomyces nodosus]MBB4796267.1 hypothetical protein [Streptomyces nodosus]